MSTVAQGKSLSELIDGVTIASLSAVLVILLVAYGISLRAMSATASKTMRFIFIWHLFDALIHFILEGSFLYHSLFSVSPTGQYGAAYSNGPFALLWQEYAKADFRWAYGDETVVSLELLTVLGEGPLAVWICYMIAKQQPQVWFWILVVAVGELYGGWMTFCPEWLTGSKNLDTSNFMYLWVYLFFFNTLWVWIPGWLCVLSYREIVGGLRMKQVSNGEAKRK